MKTLFIDFHGTICHDLFWRSLADDDVKRVQQAFFEADPSLANDWMRGLYTSEEINGLIAKRTCLDPNDLWRAFVHDCKDMHMSQRVLNVIQSLRDFYWVVLITDNMDCLDRFTVPALNLDIAFDDIANSYYERRLKADQSGASFSQYLRGDIEQAVLMDDSEANCRIFQELGGTALLVTKEEPTKRHLANLAALR